MSDISIIKLASLELQTLPQSEVVKVAGVARRLKNWWRKHQDPTYKTDIEKINDQVGPNQDLIKQLGQEINKLESAITDSDLVDYQDSFEAIKKLTKELSQNLHPSAVKSEIDEVLPPESENKIREKQRKDYEEYLASDPNVPNPEYEGARDIEPQSIKEITKVPIQEESALIREEDLAPATIREQAPISRKHYTKEELETERDKIQQEAERQLARIPEFDVSFGVHNKPVQSFKWFQQFSPNDIFINAEKGGVVLIGKIRSAASKAPLNMKKDEFISVVSSDGWLDEFGINLKKAILDGMLLKYEMGTPTKQIKHRPINQNMAVIRTAEFQFPKTAHTIQMTVEVLDKMATRNPHKSLIYSAVGSIDFRPNAVTANIKKQKLLKLAFSSQEIPRKVTTLNEVEFAKTLQNGYQKAFGKTPSVEVLGIGWAQGSLESGHPANLPCNNIGNIKASSDWLKSGKKYFVKDTKENDKRGIEYTEHGTKWRAFETPEDGAESYWKFLANRYGSAFETMHSGDPIKTAIELKKGKYYTANLQKYSKGMDRLYKYFMTSVAPKLGGLSSDKTVPASSSQIKSSPVASVDPADSLVKELFASYQIGNVSQPIAERVHFAKLASHALRSIFGAKTMIYNDNDEINLIAPKQAKYTISEMSKISENKFGHLIQIKENKLSKTAKPIMLSNLQKYSKDFKLQQLLKNSK